MSAKSLKIFSWQTLQKYKVLNTLKGEQAETIQSKTLNRKRSPQLILSSTQSPRWQATRPYSGDGGGHTAHPAHPPHQTHTRGCAGSIRLRWHINHRSFACSTQCRYQNKFPPTHRSLGVSASQGGVMLPE